MNKAANPDPVTLIEKLSARAAGNAPGPESMTLRVPVEVYTGQDRYEPERDILFLKQPVIIGHESQIPEPGRNHLHPHHADSQPAFVRKGKGTFPALLYHD